ncbi:hypothetical protein GCM10010329_84880 [Streptomyces spiroverticillatus]|uniref:Uncharacterized protein n=1 Tax=Streptomyces finlayi TaxID=67296 RepID=A0A918X9A6_9ACTN|nr:hypothetical protein GCM10010329_84880 [Streptomyces spiroverticillatus]GHD19660.1 hypothetical protein GCM10010334_83550 [Streptomyces finlayi]
MTQRPRLLVAGTFRCTVTAHGAANGQTVAFVLGEHQTPSPVLACQWLRDRARWIADRLDPDLPTTAVPLPALYVVAPDVPDAPTALRDWSRDVVRQGNAVIQLDQGQGIRFMARDDTTAYELSAVPVAVPSPVLPAESVGVP